MANENSSLQKYISHTLFSKGFVFLLCVRDEWRQGQTTVGLSSSLDHSSTSSASWLGLLNWGSLRAAALNLQTGPHSGIPVSN